MKKIIITTICFCISGCVAENDSFRRGMVPAEVFAKSVHDGKAQDFSIYKETMGVTHPVDPLTKNAITPELPTAQTAAGVDTNKWVKEGYALRESITPTTQPTLVDYTKETTESRARLGDVPAPYGPPPGSMAPYYDRQMTGNPSLWPDESSGESLFRDFRAHQPMDVITIIINEKTEGKKKADTKAESKFNILAGIAHFFGVESKSWEANNQGLDAENMIQASTESKLDAKGETKREGFLKSRISAVIMEVLPNGLLRIEGTKIVSMNAEEEVMVISGLIRTRDVDATNTVESSRIANMRIDFYGKGSLGDVQEAGWGYRIIKAVWPF